MRQIKQKVTKKAKKVLRKEERAEERELRNEIREFVAAIKVLEEPKKAYGIIMPHFVFPDMGISEGKKSARSAIEHLENAKQHIPRFLALATKIEQQIENTGVQPTIIAAAGRVIGTARYIRQHIEQYIIILNKVNVYEPPPGMSNWESLHRGKGYNLSPELVAEYMSVLDSLKEDIKHLVMALRIEKMLKGQT